MSDHYCAVCCREIYREFGRYNLDGVKPERAITTFVGVPVCSKHSDELLDKVLKEPEKATTSELEQGFVLAAAKARPDLEAEGLDW